MPAVGDIPSIGLVGVAFGGSSLCFFVGLKHSDASVASTWQAMAPVFTLSLAVAIGQEVASFMKCSGIFTAGTGAALIALMGLRGVVVHTCAHVIFALQMVFSALIIVLSK